MRGAASRELRITCVAFGIRNHPCGWIAERHGAYRPALPAFGAVEEPEKITRDRGVVRARLPYRTAKENRKVLLRIIVKQPLSAERDRSLGWSRATPHFESSPNRISFVKVIGPRIVSLRTKEYRQGHAVTPKRNSTISQVERTQSRTHHVTSIR
ncbi:hypothetical protein GEV33_002482 [Tenebrio molitor]|uniref:Uncharacterized protein n=1 Tax=Tenebrio molitor TaxID=7067 RepID=A0A8J6HTD9_TENMO|nr:hypothetical protein GEV33_002482 [Tenebrio molitor]